MSIKEHLDYVTKAKQLRDSYILKVEELMEGIEYPHSGYGGYDDLAGDVLRLCLERHKARLTLRDTVKP